MFNVLKKLFSSAAEQNEQAEDAFSVTDPRVAVAALLVHTISIDGTVDDAERTLIREVLANAYELTAKETDDLIALAQAQDQEAVDLYGFTSIIKSSFDADERMHVVEMMWEMVYADGEIHEFEDNVVWRAAELLGISTRDRVTLRQRVEARKTGDDV